MFVPDDTFMIVNWLDSALTVKRITVQALCDFYI